MKMKYWLTVCYLLLLSLQVKAQIQDPVHWTYRAEKTGDKTYTLHITATIDKGWHIYAQQQPAAAISVPTQIVFNKNPLVIITGTPKEIGKKEIQDLKEVGIKQYYYAGKVDFVQAIKLKYSSPKGGGREGAVKTNISGSITYQACTDAMCLPQKTVQFNIPVP